MKSMQNRKFAVSVVFAIIVTGVLAGYLKRPGISFNPNGSAPQSSGKNSANTRASMVEIVTGQTRHFKGSPDAPVTILEFSDFQ